MFEKELQDAKNRLFDLISERSVKKGEPKKLASGRISSSYFNMKLTLSQPQGLLDVADLMLAQLRAMPCDYIGGVEMGSVPVANAISMRSLNWDRAVPLIWVRKQAKDHGAQALVEGEKLQLLKGKRVVMTEDVTTTAGSVLKAICAAREMGMKIEHVLTIIDRQEGAAQALAAEGLKLSALFSKSDFD